MTTTKNRPLTQATIPMCPMCRSKVEKYRNASDFICLGCTPGSRTHHDGPPNYGYYFPSEVGSVVEEMTRFVDEDIEAWPYTLELWRNRLRDAR